MDRLSEEYRNILGAFCEEWDLSAQHALSFQHYEATGYSAPHSYWLTNAPRFFKTRNIEAIGVIPVLRFGNSVIQLANAVYFCQLKHIKKIHIDNHPLIGNPVIDIDGFTFLNSLDGISDESGLAGHFFYWSKLNRSLTGPSVNDQRRIAVTILRRLFDERLFSPSIDIDSSDLVLHLRGGDIFSEDIPYNPETRSTYLQPPFAFYRAAIDRERTIGELGRVVAVYEDLGNPCVAALEAYCHDHGISLVMQSGRLVEDLSVLIAARKLVWSYGSFLWSAGLLSTKLQRSYWFDDNHYANQITSALKMDGYRFRDAKGHFIKRGEWHNTPENRKMMIEYPIEALTLQALPPKK